MQRHRKKHRHAAFCRRSPTGSRKRNARDNSMNKINVAEKFSRINEMWSPKILGEVNDSYIKAVKFIGEFVWHHHDNEDEMFMVISGKLRMKFRDREEVVGPGEFIIVPRGVEHLPVSDQETQVLLFEPKTTLNTGNVRNEKTLAQLETL